MTKSLQMQRPDLDSFWIGFICGVKEVISAVQQKQHPVGSDASLILGWSFYFDIMTRFSFRHWRTELIESTAKALGYVPNTEECALQYTLARISFARNVPGIDVHAHPITQLIGRVLRTALNSSNRLYHAPEHQRSLNDLSLELENAALTSGGTEQGSEAGRHLDVARFAALVYFERVCRRFSGQSSKISKWVTKAQAQLNKLHTFPCSFALFILGCEAHSDEDRLFLLDSFTRLERAPYLRRVLEAKDLMQSAWNQHDLEVEGQLDYVHKLNLVLSSRDAIPSFI